jgi:PAS domain S-box-containing protein
MQLTLERKIAAGFAIAIAILLGIGAATWLSLVRFQREFAAVEHTHVVLNRLEQIQVQALDVQTGSRGFALSGDPTFLQPFDFGVAKIRESLAEVRQLTHDNPRQQERLSALESAVAREIQLMTRRNEARKTQGLAAALDAETLREGKLAMDRIRTLTREMEDEESALLAAHAQASQRNAALTRVALLLAIALTLAFGAAAGTRVQSDFAARQRADAALQRSRAVFETFFEQSTDAIVVVDPRGIVRRLNRRAEDLFCYPRIELIGEPVQVLMPGRFQTRHLAHVKGFQEAPKFRAMGAGLELFARRKNSGEFPVDIMLSPLETEEGPVVLAAVRDITERVAAAAELRRSTERVRDLYNRAPCGYHSLAADGLIIDINDTELEWLGYTRDEVVGKKISPTCSLRRTSTPSWKISRASRRPARSTTWNSSSSARTAPRSTCP